MNEHTNKEIEDIFKEVFSDEYWSVSVRVAVNKPDQVVVEVKKDYDGLDCNLDNLIKLSEFFGTTNIQFDDTFSQGGCPTCDYGSYQERTFRINQKGDNNV